MSPAQQEADRITGIMPMAVRLAILQDRVALQEALIARLNAKIAAYEAQWAVMQYRPAIHASPQNDDLPLRGQIG